MAASISGNNFRDAVNWLHKKAIEDTSFQQAQLKDDPEAAALYAKHMVTSDLVSAMDRFEIPVEDANNLVQEALGGAQFEFPFDVRQFVKEVSARALGISPNRLRQFVDSMRRQFLGIVEQKVVTLAEFRDAMGVYVPVGDELFIQASTSTDIHLGKSAKQSDNQIVLDLCKRLAVCFPCTQRETDNDKKAAFSATRVGLVLDSFSNQNKWGCDTYVATDVLGQEWSDQNIREMLMTAGFKGGKLLLGTLDSMADYFSPKGEFVKQTAMLKSAENENLKALNLQRNIILKNIDAVRKPLSEMLSQ